MLMKELKEQKRISHRLYRYLNVAFRDVDEERKKFNYAQKLGEQLPYGQKGKYVTELFEDQDKRFANFSLEEVLKKLNVQQPEDIMRFRGLGKTSVSELRDLIER